MSTQNTTPADTAAENATTAFAENKAIPTTTPAVASNAASTSAPTPAANVLGLPELWFEKAVTLSMVITPSGAMSVLAKVDDELVGTKAVSGSPNDFIPAPLRELLAQVARSSKERKHVSAVKKALDDDGGSGASASKPAKTAAAKPAPVKTTTARTAAVKPAAASATPAATKAPAAAAGKDAGGNQKEQASFFDSF